MSLLTRKGTPVAGDLKVLTVQQDMSVHLSRGCEMVGAAMSSS